MITGEFEVLKSMSDKQPIFTPIYFLGFMVTVIVFLANILIGLVGGHFTREINLLETEVNADQQNLTLNEVIYQIISKYYILKKRAAK